MEPPDGLKARAEPTPFFSCTVGPMPNAQHPVHGERESLKSKIVGPYLRRAPSSNLLRAKAFSLVFCYIGVVKICLPWIGVHTGCILPGLHFVYRLANRTLGCIYCVFASPPVRSQGLSITRRPEHQMLHFRGSASFIGGEPRNRGLRKIQNSLRQWQDHLPSPRDCGHEPSPTCSKKVQKSFVTKNYRNMIDLPTVGS